MDEKKRGFIGNAALTTLFVFTAISFSYLSAGLWNAVDVAARVQNADAMQGDVVRYEGIVFKNVDEFRKYLAVAKAQTWFPGIVDLPDALGLILSAMAFGGLGGTIRASHDALKEKTAIGGDAFATQGVGALIGVAALSFSYIVPSILVESKTILRPTAVLFLCLMAGMYYDQLFEWGTTSFGKVFKTKERNNDK